MHPKRNIHPLQSLKDAIFQQLVASPRFKHWAINLFHRLYYLGDELHPTWKSTTWMGVQALKCPFDLWAYQEIIHEVRPDKIIETGTYHGGTALFVASICELQNHGQVITIDTHEYRERPNHPRIQYLTGSSTDARIIHVLEGLVSSKEQTLVILDSDHHMAHVLTELNLYRHFVSPGSYLIVEDTNLGGNPVWPDFKPGPIQAVEEFLANNPDFHIDTRHEKQLLSFNPNGYLKRDE
jgi:cephalosporin hydroxylase